MSLEDKELVLGVTGGVACYKALDLVRRLKEKGARISVIMTSSAQEFIQPLAFQATSGRPVATSLFSLEGEEKIGHINIVENIDGLIVAPATANILGKVANGIADDYLSTSMLALKAPLFLAPAMNHNMWDHPAVQQNLQTLKDRNANIIPPEYGYLACGSYGTGRMAAVEKIVANLEEFFTVKAAPLQGVSVLVTAGPTREKIDAVRYLSNYSSGKMGYAIANYCRQLGAKVTLISGPTALPEPEGMQFIRVSSAAEMHQAVMQHATAAQLIIKSAAVADYRIEKPNVQKTKKKEQLTLNLTLNRDILKELGQKKGDKQFLVGFAAESQNLEGYARQKLEAKNLDLIVANNILEKDAGFDADSNRVLLIDQQNTHPLSLQPKEEIAKQIIQYVLKHQKWISMREV
ncbi:MAG: bifunctional phosphopantothenoylcysteine decarboxylase/phosphopantothenate--cysteine ligase CoaBC [SAR324 cluster bacterium]|uniref:Coenzyme A biosynthesis bifunctional protein CoaBC n=1 Tax=SAR324 cluster bacterium TaxID=2024889 RepID=A0A2A4TB01_9DELT|nr:MAG: bifunctional phosphopantothenoylcysteine decarboxylase/phosphopantothenate--cysteine ligase CoaBC [SAR324 cluster bacterium]